MKNKKVLTGEEFRKELKVGADIVYNAVSSTLGPAGCNILIESDYNEPILTKDGVTVAKSIKVKESVQNMGVQLIKQSANQTGTIAGDGTTTAVVLANSIITKGAKYISTGCNAIELQRGIELGTKEVVKEIKKLSKSIIDDKQIYQVATVSANNDVQIGELISSAIEEVGHNGLITVEDSQTAQTELEVVEGVRFNRGYLSPYFINNKTAMQVELKNPYILIYNEKIHVAKDLVKILEKIINAARPLLIIADNVEAEALAVLIVNNVRGNMTVCAVKAPEFGEKRIDYLEDIAVLTNGTVISPSKGHQLKDIELKDLGQARTITVDNMKTTIIDGAGIPEDLEKRAKEIETQIENATSDYEKEKLQDRLGKISEGVAILKIGAETEVELKEKKYRIEDALSATKAAVKEGIIAGGGVPLKFIKEKLQYDLNLDKLEITEDAKTGYKLLIDSLDAPHNKILENVFGENKSDLIWVDIRKKNSKTNCEFGYDARNKKIVNMFDEGIIDPALVTRTAIEKAASIAGLFLTTAAIVHFDEEPKENNNDEQEMYM